MHTEEEAKKKWCPMVRMYGDGEPDGSNRYNPSSKEKTGLECALCVASACMMWQWYEGKKHGFCGICNTTIKDKTMKNIIELMKNAATPIPDEMYTDCFGLARDLVAGASIVQHRKADTITVKMHYTADGLRAILLHEDGKKYEMILKPIKEKK